MTHFNTKQWEKWNRQIGMELNLSTVNPYGFSKEVYMQTNIISGISDELKISDRKWLQLDSNPELLSS